MSMRVDEPRHQRRIAEVDHHSAGWPRDTCACLANPLVFHQHFAGRKNLASRDIEEACRVQNRDVSFRLLGRGSDRVARKSNGQN